MGDKVRMMFGLVNQNKAPKAKPGEKKGGKKIAADQLAKIEIFHRSRDKKDVVGAENFTKADLPAGFLGELKAFVGAPQGSQDPTRHRASQVHRHQRRGGTIRPYSRDRPTCRTMRSTTTTRTCCRSKARRSLRPATWRNSCVSMSNIVGYMMLVERIEILPDKKAPT
jgi:hypothetical protein